MSVFTIDQDNNITAHATPVEAKSNQEGASFASAKELVQITAQWPSSPAPAKAIASKQQKSRKQATEPAEAAPARAGSKTSQVLDLLKRPGGAALQQIMAVTNWQAHSVRGFLSGTLRKKMGLTVVSEKGQNGDRVYSIE